MSSSSESSSRRKPDPDRRGRPGPSGSGADSDRTDRGLERREQLHRAIVRESPNPIFLVDVESSGIVDANPAVSRLLGYSPEELLELQLEDVDRAQAADVDDMLLRVAEKHHDILGERTFVRADGAPVPVELSANLVLDQEQELVCFFARDIRERKKAEKERSELQRQLWFSQKHEAVGRLAAGVAHDFNNLLMAVMMNVEVLRRLEPSAEQIEVLDDITGSIRRARDLTRQLLAFSGRQKLRVRPVRPAGIVQEMEKLLRRTVGEDVRLVTDLSRESGRAMVDPGQVEQVLLNLVVNARDALPRGGTITVRVEDVELDRDFAGVRPAVEPGPHVRLSVADDGTGMDRETRERIFEPFFTTKVQGKGTGLGLSTVYGIVKQSDGTIWVDSEPGGGTTFDIYFPRIEAETETGQPADPEPRPEVTGGTETILLVEDEDSVRTLTARILESLGYAVVQAPESEEALRAHRALGEEAADAGADSHPVDLVLTDVIMPGASGPDLVRRLRRERPDLGVVYMSGYADPDLEMEEGGPTRGAFLRKPFTTRSLARTLREVLDRPPD